ncbi:hypothetical protein LTS12_026734 [Elasticomyces elasticus]|nr:hypothetical protein LTS12_026734 [Elasticomyces elasticus]
MNPTINPPLLVAASSRRTLHSRSPSRSPVRQQHSRDFDPLLRDLSPSTTLRAFSSDSSNKHDSAQSALAHSFETASTSERALGVKAAQTCLDLRSWTRELEGWEWSGTFDVPEPARKKMRMSGMSMLSVRTAALDEDDEDEYWGSLPGNVVQNYEQRADEIGRELEALDVEELKTFVLSAHRRAGDDSRMNVDDSIGVIGARTDLRRLDDFTALITATILQALPYLSSLNQLLDLWTVRLSVLRQIPSYLRDLRQARTDLDHGWAAIAVSPSSGSNPSSANFTRDNMHEMQGIISQQVNSLGRRLDGFLDDLEGREETVPETWIEEFETLEAAYGDWVVQAERKVLENEWRIMRENEEREAERAKAEQALAAPQVVEGRERAISDSSFNHENHGRDRDSLVIPSSRPTSGIFDMPAEQQMDDMLLPRGHEQPREDSQTLPEGDLAQVQHPQANKGVMYVGSTIQPQLESSDRALSASSSTYKLEQVESPMSRHARHMPIIIDYSKPEDVHPSQPSASPSEGAPKTLKENADPNAPPTPPTTGVVKKRAAFLATDVEKAESLQRQVKSPVRSFEHASNAFTRLFKKDKEKTPEHQTTRSNSRRSTVSQGSAGSKRDSSGKRNSGASALDNVIWGGRKSVTGGGSPADSGKHAGSPTPNATVNKQDSAPADPREAYSRSRSASHRSSASRLTASGLGGALIDAVPISLPRQKSFQKDYMDMPGGFRTRSSSDVSRRASQRSSATLGGRLDYDGLERRLERLPEIAAPVETYQPTRRSSSPFRAPAGSTKAEYPADWPLASPPGTVAGSPVKEISDPLVPEAGTQHDGSPEIHSPRAAITTDAFDRIFVESLPVTPNPAPEFEGNPLAKSPPPSARSRPASALGMLVSRRESTRSQVPTLDDSMLGPEEDRWSPRAEDQTSRTATPLSNKGKEAARNIDETSYFPGQPSPEPAAMSRASSSATTKAQARLSAPPPSSPMPLKLQIPASETPPVDDEVQMVDAKPVLLHRASTTSIESHPRSALRSIELPRHMRHMSGGSIASIPETPIDPVPTIESAVSSAGDKRSTPSSPRAMNWKGLVVFPTPPTHGVGRRASVPNENPNGLDSPVSPISRQHSPGKTEFTGTPLEKRMPDSPVSEAEDSPAPLNAAMGKRQGKARTADKSPVTSPRPKTATPKKLKPGEDNFDRHVSEVLDRLPSQAIKFRARPGTVTPNHQRTAEPRNYSGPRPNGIGRVASRLSDMSDGLTLAPAESSPKKSSTAVDDVKLYHLRQAGREEPIKLFVRLVGESERVMVRVGGGWQDLADYLRQYAEHHGSRTVSAGGIELQTAEHASSRKVSGQTTAGAADTKGKALPVSPVAAALPVPVRPGSRAADMKWFKLDDSSPSGDGEEAPLQTPPPTSAAEFTTPKSTSTKGTSRPTTADSLGRPGSRQSLASRGVNGKRAVDLPEQKARWVEGMLEKAKVASAEKKVDKDDKAKYFGELGKAGATRRMIFRQSSTANVASGNAENENVKP